VKEYGDGGEGCKGTVDLLCDVSHWCPIPYGEINEDKGKKRWLNTGFADMSACSEGFEGGVEKKCKKNGDGITVQGVRETAEGKANGLYG
jgi:hypothetical protein